ncbi:4a-hydroxytetrahydrobiopterin dehydratase [Donghicola sp. XS_ASV15]|uniref:4a-hydroxytetrahydrobiopterin dehydratase n=1 Tax=Donghicola sp. XS_ASV15 TaxID=3241295 RepID=UPI00351257F7
MTDQLTETERSKAMAELESEGWTLNDAGTAIERRFKFPDFPNALAWMVKIGVAAEKMDHHPEWSNVYNRVDVRLTTHDAGGLTALDIQLARIMNAQ